MKNNFKFWKTFYKIRYYPSITVKQTVDETKFVKEFLSIKKYKNILDFVCGFGRHSIELAKNGYNIEGFDIDKESVENAKKIITETNLKNIKLYKKDAFKFKKQNFFDAAICLYSSIGFLEKEINDIVFANLFKSVRIGGRIILDVMNSDWAIKNLKSYSEKEIIYKGKKYIINHNREILVNPIREKNTIKFIEENGEKIHTVFYIIQLYSYEELQEKFLKNNFKIYKKFGSFQKDRISSKNQRIIIIADKFGY